MVRHSEKHLIIILHPSSLSHNNHLNHQMSNYMIVKFAPIFKPVSRAWQTVIFIIYWNKFVNYFTVDNQVPQNIPRLFYKIAGD